MMTFERSPDTDALVVVLRRVNGACSYEQLARQTKLGVQRVKALLPSARRVLQREKVLFGTERGVGVQRMKDDDKVRMIPHDNKRVVRAVKRNQKKLETIEKFELLPTRDQAIVTTARTINALIRQQLAVKVE